MATEVTSVQIALLPNASEMQLAPGHSTFFTYHPVTSRTVMSTYRSHYLKKIPQRKQEIKENI